MHISVRKENRREETKEENLEAAKDGRNPMAKHGVPKDETNEIRQKEKGKDSKARAIYAKSLDRMPATAANQEREKARGAYAGDCAEETEKEEEEEEEACAEEACAW